MRDGAVKLAQSIRFYFTNRRIIYIMGILRIRKQKNDPQYLSVCGGVITVAAPGNPRAVPYDELAGEVRRYHGNVTAADSLRKEAVAAGREKMMLSFRRPLSGGSD